MNALRPAGLTGRPSAVTTGMPRAEEFDSAALTSLKKSAKAGAPGS